MANEITWVPPIKEGDVPSGKTAKWDGTQWNVVDHILPPVEPSEQEKTDRAKSACITQREMLLQTSDFIFAPDSQINQADLPAWQQYRQALRDISNDPNWLIDSTKVNWPTAPVYRKK
jgi:hypothetical protein